MKAREGEKTHMHHAATHGRPLVIPRAAVYRRAAVTRIMTTILKTLAAPLVGVPFVRAFCGSFFIKPSPL